MPAFTPNLNLYKPGGGSTGLITPDEVVDVDRFNNNFEIIDEAIGNPDEQNRQWYLPAASLTTLVGMRRGDRFTASDTGRQWEFDGANWFSGEAGMVIIRPTAVSGLSQMSIQPNGEVRGSNVPNGRFNVDGVFSSLYRRYRIDVHIRGKASAGTLSDVVGRNNGVDISSSAHFVTIQGTINGNVNGPIQQTVQSSFKALLDDQGTTVHTVLEGYDLNNAAWPKLFMARVVGRGGAVSDVLKTSSLEGAFTLTGLGCDIGQNCQEVVMRFYAYR